MSQIARVFAVLNLVLAAGFLFAAGTFLGAKSNYITLLSDEKTGRAEDNRISQDKQTTLNASMAELSANNAGLREKNAQIEARSAEMRARIDALEGESQTKNTQIAALTADVNSAIEASRRSAEETRRVTDKNLELVAQIKDTQTAEQAAKEAESLAKTTIVDKDNAIAALEREKTRIDNEKHELSLIIEAVRANSPIDMTKLVKMEPVDARVIGVDHDLKLVQFNVGSKASVAKGYTIDVVRGGTYIGRVRIDQVYPDTCAGTLMYANESQRPMVGDRGTNTL